MGAGAADTVAPAMIGDVYFMDHRGRAMVRPLDDINQYYYLSVETDYILNSRLFTLSFCPLAPLSAA